MARGDVALYKVHKGTPGSAMWVSLPQMSQTGNPQLLVFDKAGALKRIYNGHSILSTVPGAPDGMEAQGAFPWKQR